jgi:hypothetical protein
MEIPRPVPVQSIELKMTFMEQEMDRAILQTLIY